MADLFESHYEFCSDAYQIPGLLRDSNFRSSVDIIPIRFYEVKIYGDYNPGTQDYEIQPPTVLLEKTLKLRFLRERPTGNAKITMERFAKYKRVIAHSPREARKLENKLGRYLCGAVGLPEDKHPMIISQILEALQSAKPDRPIEVQLLDIMQRDTLDSLQLHLGIDEAYYRAKLIPASDSFIQDLEQVRILDDDNQELLELECPVCMEVFADRKYMRIIKLPCSHYYHRDCIVPWLQINHVRPTCRHPNAPQRS